MKLSFALPRKHFYDKRVWNRCNLIIDKIINSPQTPLTTLFESGSDTVGVWRFLKNEKFNHKIIMNGFYDSTKKLVNKMFKLRPDKEIYVIQDTSTIDLTDNIASIGLGYITSHKAFWHLNKNKADPSKDNIKYMEDFKKFSHKGLYLHTSLACTTDGEPIGITYQDQIVRDFEKAGIRRDKSFRSIEEKESFKWIDSVNETLKLNLNQSITFIADREADIFEVFNYDYTKVSEKQKIDFVIRASGKRQVSMVGSPTDTHSEKTYKLRELSQSITTLNQFKTIQNIPRTRTRDEKEVEMTISYSPIRIKGKKIVKPSKLERVELGIPVHSKIEYQKDLELNVVIIENKEENLEWILFTTKSVTNKKEALTILDAYKKRWLIERFHYTLKSGFKVEEMKYQDHRSLQKMIAIYSIAAMQILRLTMISRSDPDRSCTTIVEDDDWKPLYTTIHQTKALPKKPPTILEYTMMLARLGGYLSWQKQLPPGVVVLWRGIARLHQIKKIYPVLV